MEALIALSCGRIHDAHKFDLVLDGEASVLLTGIPDNLPIDWYANHDEVLAIKDNGSTRAKITATALGKSVVEMRHRGRLLGLLRIEVIEDKDNEAVGFSSTVGDEIPDTP